MPPEARRSRLLPTLLGVAASVALLWLLIRQVDGTLLRQSVRNADVPLMLLAILLATLTFPLRVPRWRLLLPDTPEGPIPTRALWHAIAIGFTANTLIPWRVGEVVRAATISRLTRIPFGTTFASLAVERAIDGLVVVALLGIGLATADLPPHLVLEDGTLVGPLVARAGTIFLGATILAVVMAWQADLTLRILRRILPSRKGSERFLTFAGQVLSGLGALRDPRRALPIIGWSSAVWVVNAAAFWVGCRAFGLTIPFPGSFILNGLVVAGVAVPLLPGGAGGFEYFLVSGLRLFGADKAVATGFALTFHLTTAIPILLLGFWSLRRIGGSLLPGRDLPP